MLGFLGAPIGVAYHVVLALSALLTPLGAGLATAAAIALFTVGVRLTLSPLSYHAYRGQSSMAALQPKITELRRRYPNQPDKLQQELTAMYRAEGGSALAGCLPLLLQLPFFSIMYRLFLSARVGGQPNALLARDLLRTPLGSHWLTAPGPASMQGLLFVALFVLLAGAAFMAARATRAASPGSAGSAGQPAAAAALGRILPYTTVAIAAFVPLAAGIYLLTSTAWSAAERAVLRRWIAAPPR